jgi:hypothetical protein
MNLLVDSRNGLFFLKKNNSQLDASAAIVVSCMQMSSRPIIQHRVVVPAAGCDRFEVLR